MEKRGKVSGKMEIEKEKYNKIKKGLSEIFQNGGISSEHYFGYEIEYYQNNNLVKAVVEQNRFAVAIV